MPADTLELNKPTYTCESKVPNTAQLKFIYRKAIETMVDESYGQLFSQVIFSITKPAKTHTMYTNLRQVHLREWSPYVQKVVK